ncbi:uncharacterized protein TEOVI_000213600 [Trypanosoma equiperdum]|uniref:Uncharacterized protein n=2 Tax=Trypanozoon TaxID=39700 RepID=Q57TY3_TRYB2|nr:hypothetical protein, conserved [Trypanosoma brucei brucei TREU927]AAX79973.1 hypothetical protein, conserved [Trypanosoma brucei]AAZ12807.1 hypothetical protein, conserved [Trypanosoma brucei brucei TREU927]SCU70562.1 hypothetical protein, conserved [Trypanosoma equiperdum]
MVFSTHGIRVVYNTANVDRSLYAVVHCSDGKYAEVSKDHLNRLKFIEKSSEEEDIEFDYPEAVLESLAQWTLKYGMDGVAVSSTVRPCIYRNVQHVLKDDWEREFFTTRLMNDLNIMHYLQTINAAEKYEMKGFHDFLCVCLSCKLRNEEDTELVHKIMGLEDFVEIGPSDLDEAACRYTWLDQAIKPTVRR